MKKYKIIACPDPNMFCVIKDLRTRDDIDDIPDESKELFKGTIQQCQNFLHMLDIRDNNK